jgi:peptidase M60-like protein
MKENRNNYQHMKGMIFKKSLGYLFLLCLVIQGCDVGYEFNIESGIDDYKGDKSTVTIDTLSSIDVTMYERARVFPGLVDTLTERRTADTAISLDLSRQGTDAFISGIKAPPLPIYSTGLYAGAGELVTITVDNNVMGLSVQIGAHMDDLASTGTTSREPVVYTKKALFPGKNYVRNNLGGYIWIIKQQNVTGSPNFKLKLQNVYKAPDYVVNTNIDVAAWANQVRNTTVPWLELRGKHVAFSVSRNRILNKMQESPSWIGNLETLLNTWDRVMEKYYHEYYGLTQGNNDVKFRSPDFPDRVVLDVQLENNVYMRWTGQPIVALNTNVMMNDLTDLNGLISGSSISTFTALGNNYALAISPWWTQMAAAAKILPLYRLSEQSFKDGLTPRISDIFTAENTGINQQFPLALSYAAADSSKLLRTDPTTNFDAFALLPLVQLAYYNNDNWAFYSHLNKLMKGNRPPVGQDAFFAELCAYFGKDFSPFFDHWGIDLGDRARAQGRAYPILDKTIWKYNPLVSNPNAQVSAYDASGYRYKNIRSSWEVRAFDKNYNNNDQPDDNGAAVQTILDGNKATYWHSQWRPANLPIPHYIVIDMKNKQQVDGFFFAHGSRNYRVAHMILQTTDADEIDLDDMSVNWYKIAEIRSAQDFGNYSAADGVKPYGEGLAKKYRNDMFYEFISRKNVRYLRVVIPDISLDNSVLHTMAEFGTFYYK